MTDVKWNGKRGGYLRSDRQGFLNIWGVCFWLCMCFLCFYLHCSCEVTFIRLSVLNVACLCSAWSSWFRLIMSIRTLGILFFHLDHLHVDILIKNQLIVAGIFFMLISLPVFCLFIGWSEIKIILSCAVLDENIVYFDRGISSKLFLKVDNSVTLCVQHCCDRAVVAGTA